MSLRLLSLLMFLFLAGCYLNANLTNLNSELPKNLEETTNKLPLELDLCVNNYLEGESITCLAKTTEGIEKTFSLSSENTCTFLTIDSNNGKVTGTPSLLDSGTCSLVIKVSSSQGAGELTKNLVINSKTEVLRGGNLTAFIGANPPSSVKLSLDQSRLFFLIQNSVTGTQLYTVMTDGSGFKRLGPSNIDILDYVISDTSNSIIFKSRGEDHISYFDGEIYSVAFDGSNFKKISASSEKINEFTADPASNFVVYHDTTSNQVFKIQTDGTGKTSLLTTPQASPFGFDKFFKIVDSRLLFLASAGGNCLFSVPLSGAGEVRLHIPPVLFGGVKYIQVSPDKTKVAFVADLETLSKDELYIANIDGTNKLKLNVALPSTGDVNSVFQFTPDSSKVVYVASQNTNVNTELYTVNVDGTNNIKLTPPLGPGENVSYGAYQNCFVVTSNPSCPFFISSDGSKVFYVADQDTNNTYDIYSVNIDGTSNTKISGATSFTGVSYFYLSPDNSKIVFKTKMGADNYYKLYKVNSDGTNLTRIDTSTTGVYYTFFAFTPTSDNILLDLYESAAGGYNTTFIDLANNNRTALAGVNLSNMLLSLSNLSFFSVSSTALVKTRYDNKTASVMAQMPILAENLKIKEFAGSEYFSILNSQDYNNIFFTGTDFYINKFNFNLLSQSQLFIELSATLRAISSINSKLIFSNYPFKSINFDGTSQVDLNVAPMNKPSQFQVLSSGKIILAVEQYITFATELISINSDGSALTRLNVPIASASNEIVDFKVTPDESKIVYNTSEDGTRKLKVIEPNGANRVDLSPIADYDPLYKISPDSSKVIWQDSTSKSNPTYHISTLSGAISPFQAGDLTNPSAKIDSHFEWTPDSQKVVLISDVQTPGKKELFTINAAPGLHTKINRSLVSGGNVTDFVISKNGDWIIYRADAEIDEKYELYAINTRTGFHEKISGSLVNGGSVRYEGFSIDERFGYVVFLAAKDHPEIEEIYSVNLKNLAIVKLNSNLSLAGRVHPSFTLTSSGRVFYISDENMTGVPSISWVSLDGRSKRKIDNCNTFGAGVKYFSVNVDGTKGYYVAYRNSLLGYEAIQFSF